MATNAVDVSAARPDQAALGSMDMSALFAPPADGSPGFLAPTFAYSRIPFGTTKAVRVMPDWIEPVRDRADAVRKINQDDVLDLDAASLQDLSLSPEERGLWAKVDYRQPQVAVGLGPIMAEALARRQSLAYLLNTIELVTLSAGKASTPTAPFGVNIATRLGGSGAESEVVNASSLPFNSTGTVDLDDPDSDFAGLFSTAIEAFETAHNITPNTVWMANAVKHGILRNNSMLSLVDREFSFGDLQGEFARKGISRIHVGRNNRGLASDVMILARVDGTPGGESAQGYNPMVVGATDQIDAKGEDYAMGANLPGSPLLASLIGYRSTKPAAGSIEKFRAACNYDSDVNYRGIVRIVNLFNGR